MELRCNRDDGWNYILIINLQWDNDIITESCIEVDAHGSQFSLMARSG